jgi:hypothetical protein
MSNKSFAERTRLANALMADTAVGMGVSVIDLESQIRPMLRARDDLYDDKWHFSPAGSTVAAELIAERIRRDQGWLGGEPRSGTGLRDGSR